MKQADISDENLRLIDTLKKLPIFNTLDDFRLKDLLKLCKLRQYEKGERIFEENTFDNYIFFLVSGKVRIERNGIALGTLRRLGDAYGIVEVIDAKPRPASIYAEEDTVCILMDAAYMDRLPEKDKAVHLYIVYRIFTEVLSERLRSTTEELIKTKEELAKAASAVLQPG
jgi:signal-transduction protein with cAMP-binding, CBS, and nucleotidyltransferase domain